MATTKTELLINGSVVATKTTAPFLPFNYDTTGLSGSVTVAVREYIDGALAGTTPVVNGSISDSLPSGTPIVWRDFVNTNSTGDGQLKIIQTETLAGAYSTQAISNNTTDINGIKFTIPNVATGEAGIGLSNNYESLEINGFNMTIWLQLSNDNQTVKVFETGTNKYEQALVANDVAEIRVENNLFKVYINNILVYTSAQSFNYPLTAIALLSNKQAASEILSSEFLTDTNLITSPL